MTRYAGHMIPDNTTREALNVYWDEDIGVTRRKGFAKYNATAITAGKTVRGLWPFTADDGTRYMVALCSATLYQTSGDGSFTKITGAEGLSETEAMDAVTTLGKIWFANGTDTVFNWDGASRSAVAGAPLGDKIEAWRNRVVITGKSGELSYVHMSGELDGTNFTTGPTRSTSPVSIAIGGTNAKPVKCMYGGYRDVFMVWTEEETYGIYGFGLKDFIVRQLSNEVGCIEDESVQEKGNALYWMSKRGIEKMSGTTVETISRGVNDVYDILIDNIANSRYVLDTTQAHFQAGNLTASGPGAPMSATRSPFNVVATTWTVTNTTTADFDAGTLTDVTAAHIANLLQIDQSEFDYFTDGNYTSNPTWTDNSLGDGAWSITSNALKWTVATGGAASIYTASAMVTGRWQYSVTCNTGATQFFFIANNPNFFASNVNGYYITWEDAAKKLTLIRSDGGSAATLDTATLGAVLTLGDIIDVTRTGTGLTKVYVNGVEKISATDNTYTASSYMIIIGEVVTLSYDNFNLQSGDTSAIPKSGTFVSQKFDTTVSTPVPGQFNVTDSKPVGTSLFYDVREASTTNGKWGSWTATSDTLRAPFTKRWQQYRARFDTAFSAVTPLFYDATLSATTTGYFIHQGFATSADISSWGNFVANYVTAGLATVTFSLSTGTNANQVTRSTAIWHSQINNSVIALDTATYVGVRTYIGPTSSTDTALLQDISIYWNEGAFRPAVATTIFDDRYYMSYTSSSISGRQNDFIGVFDSRNAPTFLTGMRCFSFGLYERKWYCGSATDNGYVYQLEVGEDDDGESYTSSFRTKSYAFGDQDAEKEFVKMYVSLAPETDSILDVNISAYYRVDGSTSRISMGILNLGEDPTAGILMSKVPFPLSGNLSGRYADFEFVNVGKNQSWTIFGISIYFRTYEIK